jgi:hypothetical protein
MPDTSPLGDMPPELEPLHQRLLADSAAWSGRLPSTARLRAHTKLLASDPGDVVADDVTGLPISRATDLFRREDVEVEDVERTDVEDSLVRTPIRLSRATQPSRIRGLFATVAAVVIVMLLAGTLYAMRGRLGGAGGLGPTPPPTGVGIPGSQARYVPSAVAAHGVDATGAPVRQDSSFYSGALIYIVARVQGVRPGEQHTLMISWYVDGQRADQGLPTDSVKHAVTADGYVHFQFKLPQGTGVGKLYWDLPAFDVSNADAALAQTVAFTVLPPLPMPTKPGITSTVTPALP